MKCNKKVHVFEKLHTTTCTFSFYEDRILYRGGMKRTEKE